MDINNFKKAGKDQTSEVEVAATILAKSGKKVKIMGIIRDLPLEPAAVEHFAQHKSEYVWRTKPIQNVREDVDGLYCAVWLTDKFDYIPVLYMTEQVMESILEIK